MKKILLLALTLSLPASAQEPLESESFQGLELRGIGPALMSGRIADIAIHPKRRSTWYVAVGSGGVWKTTNSERPGARSSTLQFSVLSQEPLQLIERWLSFCAPQTTSREAAGGDTVT
jgi:hypothetical protein